MLGGQYDFEARPDTSLKLLVDMLGTPPEHKKYRIIENAGHVPPRIEVIREVLDWLDRYFGPITRAGQ